MKELGGIEFGKLFSACSLAEHPYIDNWVQGEQDLRLHFISALARSET